MIGIDKMLLKKLNIGQADIEVLKKNGFIVIQDDKSTARIFKDAKTGEEIAINYIKVSHKHNPDTLINDLKIGKAEIEGIRGVEYEHLNITLPKGISNTRTNEKNINNTDDLNRSIGRYEEELEVLGFGKTHLKDTEVKEIEINANIELERPFQEYKEVFEYLRGLLPRGIKSLSNGSYEPRGVYTGFIVGNGSVNLKFYDKKTNISNKYGIELEKELLRVEYTFLNEQKVKLVFGSNKFEEVTKDFKEIEGVFKKTLGADLINRIYQDIDNQRKHAVRHIKKYKEVGGISATNNYLKNHQADLLDIEIVLSALRDTETKKNYSRQAKETISSTREIEGKKLFGNINKLNEILEKLGFEEIKLDMTRGIRKEVEKYYL